MNCNYLAYQNNFCPPLPDAAIDCAIKAVQLCNEGELKPPLNCPAANLARPGIVKT
jgi:hypothetical protein